MVRELKAEDDNAWYAMRSALWPDCTSEKVIAGAVAQPQLAAMEAAALKGFFAIGMCTDYFRHIVMLDGAPSRRFPGAMDGRTDFRLRLRVPR